MFGSVACVRSTVAQSAPAVPSQRFRVTTLFFLGTAWYPEQVAESRWDEDLRLMEAANIKVVRITEFAWSRMEPAEGLFDLEWLDRAIALAAKHHIVSVLGTPHGDASGLAYAEASGNPARGA